MRRNPLRSAALVVLTIIAGSWSVAARQAPAGAALPVSPAPPAAAARQPPPQYFERMLQQQAQTDKTWRDAAAGYMQVDKITYRSQAGDMDIPYWVFQPLTIRGPKLHPALVWTHENIRGHLYEHYIPYIREATAKGYIVIAPEYRGSIGYGKAFYDAIDYGGREVDDVVTAVEMSEDEVSGGRSGAHRDHRMEPRRDDHAPLRSRGTRRCSRRRSRWCR